MVFATELESAGPLRPQADAVQAARQSTLDHAFRLNPERLVGKAPEPPAKPTAVWINPSLKAQNNQGDVQNQTHDLHFLSLTHSLRLAAKNRFDYSDAPPKSSAPLPLSYYR
jgi:hypothetical protein